MDPGPWTLLSHLWLLAPVYVRVAQGIASESPILDQKTWTFQRSCDAVANIIERADYVLRTLPDVIAGLRAAAPQLQASCLAPARKWPQEDISAYVNNGTCTNHRKP